VSGIIHTNYLKCKWKLGKRKMNIGLKIGENSTRIRGQYYVFH